MDSAQLDLHIGIDVGGTNIKAGMVTSEGHLAMSASLKTAATQGAILDQVCGLVEGMLGSLAAEAAGRRVRGIGIAIPGIVDVEKGVAVTAVNLPWDNLPVSAVLTRKFHLPVRLEKDTDAGALGELCFGKAKGVKHAVYVAIGTGVGGGLILNGQLYYGNGVAGDIGHMIALSDGPVCKCGTRGCLEAMASSLAIVSTASANCGRTFSDTAEVFAAAASGDTGAQTAIDRAGEALASALISLTRILQPEVFVIGGGVAKAGSQLLKAIDAGFALLSPGWIPPPIELSNTADWSGVLGAAASVANVVNNN